MVTAQEKVAMLMFSEINNVGRNGIFIVHNKPFLSNTNLKVVYILPVFFFTEVIVGH